MTKLFSLVAIIFGIQTLLIATIYGNHQHDVSFEWATLVEAADPNWNETIYTLYHPESGVTRHLFQSDDAYTYWRWSPDAQWILTTNGSYPDKQLLQINRITHQIEPTDTPPEFTFDDEVWSKNEWWGVTRITNDTQTTLYRIKADGSELKPFITLPFNPTAMVVSSSGEWVIVVAQSEDDTTFDIFRIQVASGERQHLLSGDKEVYRLELSPNEKTLLLAANQSSYITSTLYAINLENGQSHTITSDVERRYFDFHWLNHETVVTVAFIYAGTTEKAVERIDLATNTIDRIQEEVQLIDALAWSPDGTQFATVVNLFQYRQRFWAYFRAVIFVNIQTGDTIVVPFVEFCSYVNGPGCTIYWKNARDVVIFGADNRGNFILHQISQDTTFMKTFDPRQAFGLTFEDPNWSPRNNEWFRFSDFGHLAIDPSDVTLHLYSINTGQLSHYQSPYQRLNIVNWVTIPIKDQDSKRAVFGGIFSLLIGGVNLCATTWLKHQSSIFHKFSNPATLL